ncbi:MAG: DUF116 domain-containing protein [Methanosarcinaceae archaeon]|nr:DUF116 domain-containing protein [Methanosarcinaceae archaeon]MDD4496882.1 DUF116 domain-containing protein [Methanosarcinaceae archaeon]
MYDLIGKILFAGIIFSVLLASLALSVSRISLNRHVWLAGFFSNVLDFFYLPLRYFFVQFSDYRVLDKWMSSMKNIAHKSDFSKTKNRIILAPHCMRALDCPAYSTKEGIQCKACGKCVFTRMKKDAESYGYRLYIITGSSFVRHVLSADRSIDGVLLVACDYELNKVMRGLNGKNVVTYGIPMERDGCYGTEVDYNKVISTFEAFKFKDSF